MVYIQYIPDEEINLEKQDLLGTLPYVNAILKVIEHCETPFTIGLFGGWGCGKSSIVKTLKEKISNGKISKFRVFYYDAWKYSNDSLRRTFLLQMIKNLDIKTKQNLETIFFKEKLEEKNLEVKININLFVVSLYIAIVIVVLVILWVFYYKQWVLSTILSAMSLVNSLFFFFIKSAFIRYKTTVLTPRVFAPEQFEAIFNEIIDEITQKMKRREWIEKKYREQEKVEKTIRTIQKMKRREWIEKKYREQEKVEKLIIIIDNIDRCRKETAIEIMLTIKTFLEKEGCVFVIPIDDLAIREFIDSVGPTISNSSKEVDGKEFLRKFFNTTFKIKDFTNLDLYDFAKTLNRKYKLNFSNSILHLVAREFAKSPRKIIQFLNNLQSERVWYQIAIKNQNIPNGTVLENLEFLAKMLIVRDEWPDLYNQIAHNPRLLRLINKAIAQDSFENIRHILNKDQYEFFKRTKVFLANNEELFFITRDNLQDLPDKIHKLVDNFDWKSIKKYISAKEIEFQRFFDYIYDRFHKEVVNQGLIETTGFSIISLILKIYLEKEARNKLKSRTKEILTLCDKQYLKPLVETLNHHDLVAFAKIFYERGYNSIIRTILEVIDGFSESDIEKESSLSLIANLVTQFIQHKEIIRELRDIFSVLIRKKPNSITNFNEVLRYPENLVPLLERNVVIFLINSIDPKSNEITRLKLKFLHAMLYTDEYNNEIFMLVNKLVGFANRNDINIISVWLEATKPFIINKVERIFDSVFRMLTDRHRFLSSYVNSKSDFNDKELKALITFVDFCEVVYQQFRNNREQVGAFIDTFYIEKLPKILDRITNFYKDFVSFHTDFDRILVRRMLKKIDVFSKNENKDKAFSVIKQILANKDAVDIIENDVNLILSKLFSIYLEENKEISDLSKRWIISVSNIPHIRPHIANKISNSSLTDVDFKKILELVLSMDEKKQKVELIKDIIIKTEVVSNIHAIVEFVYNSKDNGKEVVKDVLYALVKNLDIQNLTFYKAVLELCVKYISLFNLNQKGTIARKLRTLLDSSDQLFALELLNQIDELPKGMKSRICEELKDIQEFRDEKQIAILNSVKKKFCG